MNKNRSGMERPIRRQNNNKHKRKHTTKSKTKNILLPKRKKETTKQTNRIQHNHRQMARLQRNNTPKRRCRMNIEQIIPKDKQQKLEEKYNENQSKPPSAPECPIIPDKVIEEYIEDTNCKVNIQDFIDARTRLS